MIDSHCHLAGEEFAGELDAIATRAREAGVEAALCIVESEDDGELERAAQVHKAWPGVRFATGIHPHHAGKFGDRVDAAIETVRQAIDRIGACGLGEIGLDYHYDFSPREVQHHVFRVQVQLARERDLPIIVHTREAAADTFRILREEGATRGVFHCFTGDGAMAQEALALGFHLSFAGILTFPKAGDLRDVARQTPLERVLSETDAPYLAPVPHRGKRNEPAFVTRVVETLAELHGLSRDDMARRIATNFNNVFGLAR